MQERLKSKVVWVTVTGLIIGLLGAWGVYDLFLESLTTLQTKKISN